MPAKTPLTLITGTLGSGKTTLLRHLLQQADRRLAVLVNEFGEIAIDSRVVSGRNIRMVELAGGCVCCELTGELEAAVRELLSSAAPDHMVLEATGVAESDALVDEVQEGLPEVRLDSTVCIVDADTSVRFPHIGQVGRRQLEAADIVLINKVDLVSASQVQEIIRRVRRYNDTPALFETVRGAVDPRLLWGPGRPENPIRPRRVRSPREHQEHPLDSFVFESRSPFNRACFEQVADWLGEKIVRAKGFVHTRRGGFLYNQVVGRWELEPFAADRTQLVFIGRDLAAVEEQVKKALRACEE